jgi:hypothetical protein
VTGKCFLANTTSVFHYNWRLSRVQICLTKHSAFTENQRSTMLHLAALPPHLYFFASRSTRLGLRSKHHKHSLSLGAHHERHCMRGQDPIVPVVIATTRKMISGRRTHGLPGKFWRIHQLPEVIHTTWTFTMIMRAAYHTWWFYCP